MNSTSYMAGPEVGRMQRRALGVGVAALALCVAGAIASPAQFFRSYLFGYLFWTGVALGCLAIVMLQHLSGGAWGMVIRRMLESGSRTLPLMALLFVPLIPGIRQLYGWARSDNAISYQAAYLNVPFFLFRALLYFLVWLSIAYFLNRWSREQDRTGDLRLARRLQLLSGPGLVLYGLTATFAAIDWVMSLEPHWYSSIFGILIIGGQALSAMAFIIAVAVLLAQHEPLSGVLLPSHFNDLGKLLLTFVMLWAYFAFSQLLIIWSGNLPEEIPWYLHRLHSGWRWVGVLLILFHFALPFVLLLSRDLKRNARALALLAVGVIFMRLVDLFWLTAPEFWPGSFHLHWMDIAAPVGIGGVWLAVFAWQLRGWPLLPIGDRYLEKALEHGQGH
ncbi:MAG: hypothetical protein WAR21_11140 [Candidatus Acidiferrales bacterium]